MMLLGCVFENVNRLPASKTRCHSDKLSRLRHIWSKLNINFILLLTQINPSLPPIKYYPHAAMLQNNLATSTLRNNMNELIGRRQQYGSMKAAQGEVAKHATSTGTDPTSVGRWNCIDVVNDEKNCESYLHVNACDRKHRLARCIFNGDDTFSREISKHAPANCSLCI